QLFLGIIYVWSEFVAPVSAFFQWEAAAVKLTSSFMLCCFVLGILASGRLQSKVRAQKIVLAGGLLMAAGMLVASFIPRTSQAVWLIYVAYGIVGGFGVGLAYNTVITCAQKWFPHKRGMATGISVCMFGFSTVVFAPLVKALIGFNAETGAFSGFGPVTTFRILAAAFAVVTVALFHLVRLPDEGAAPQGRASVAALSGKQYTTGEILKTGRFYFIALSMMFFTASYFILNPSFKDFASNRGLADTVGTVIVMMTGIASALGRLAVPMLADKIGRENATFAIIAATAVSTAALCVNSGAIYIAAVAVIAFCYGGSSGVYPLVTADHFGLKNVGSNYGAVMVGFMISALLFPMIIGLVADMTVKFIVLAILAAVAAAMIVLLSRAKKKAA
ncbi:MAG: MFS transporter, partial [Oscillospiraceae bacterium]|nr:MFS transporter [Oscillospiraceae bacterium]